MAEHYTRFIVCVPISNKEAGSRLTRLSPEGNGLTERVAKTIIKYYCFKKLAVDRGLVYDWDELLRSLVVSYNAAKHESATGVAHFTLLFAQVATVPPELRDTPNLDFEEGDLDSRVKDLLQRAQKPRTGMEVATKPAILKLMKMQTDGVVVLEDNTRLRGKSAVQNIVACHLQVKYQYDCNAAFPSKHLACEICRCLGTDVVAASAEVAHAAFQLRHLSSGECLPCAGWSLPLLTVLLGPTSAGSSFASAPNFSLSLSTLQWGLVLVTTVAHEVKRLAMEVIKEHWTHLSVMNNDWDLHLNKRPEAMDALQPSNYRAWKKSMRRFAADGATTEGAEQGRALV
ncbi:hypothetical protein CYMTET_22024 [Cymbomonas tetramitiformis]|uniref:Integrase catalytic domain-containing protein n=1 Tax=Cymbomonas tetramitiformis TaxID=36881 RepID=A0AAE0L2E5_9CHLO|nr:hypothetical protein CYMTET_22024 [Cymbomonas tetramitiformis]